MADEPNYEEMMDKAFGPRPSVADNSEAEQPTPETPADTTPEVPAVPVVADDEPGIDASVILMREDYSRKMHEVGQQRRALDAEKARLRDLQEFADRLESDEQFRTSYEQAWQAVQNGQAPGVAPTGGPDPALTARIARLESTLMQREQQAHLNTLDAESRRIAQEYGIAAKDMQQVVMKAAKAGLLDYGTPPEQVRERLDMAAARHVLPTAKANGQRQLLDQIKDKGRAATVVAERTAPPEPEPDVTKMSESAYIKHLVDIAEKTGRGAS
jgi:hypothetical protein